MTPKNYLTIDVEDYYQVSAFEDLVEKKGWDGYASRVERNTEKILVLLEQYEVRGTFFILGWTAAKHPDLVKKISAAGHEVACHSYLHRLVYDLTPQEFRDDTRKAKDILEQITGLPVLGYRAPSYSITTKSLWAVEILLELGFRYSSSVFPVYHDRYGIPAAPRFPFLWDLSGDTPQMSAIKNKKTTEILGELVKEGSPTTTGNHVSLLEIPVSTSLQFSKNIPISGGGYFRLFPYWFTRIALRHINNKEGQPFIFYLHPWEIDPEQPRMHKAKLRSRFRHYLNLHRTLGRFDKLLQDFSFRPIYDRRTGAVPPLQTEKVS